MTAKEAFGVGVRIVGLLIVLAALAYLASAVVLFFNPQYRPGASPPLRYTVTGLAFLAIGLYFLRGAPYILRFAYPTREHSDEATRRI